MSEHLFIRMSDRSDQATIVALNDDGHLIRGPETIFLSAVAERSEGMQVTVLLPARDLVSCVAKIPASSPARLRQMLPFSLEDEFAGDVEELHFAAGARNESDELAVSVIARERFEFWLDALKAAGVPMRRICSEADAVPDTLGVVTLFLEGRKILGRRAGGAPFFFEELNLSELWRLLAAEREDADDLENVVLFVDRDTRSERSSEIDAWQAAVGNLNVKELADGCLPKLAAGLVFQSGTNLLQGDYAPRSNFRALAQPWRAAAAFALVFLAFSVLGKGAEFFKLSRDNDLLIAETDAICAESYSSAQESRCLIEMGRRLADSGQTALGSGDGFLSTLTAVAELLDDAMSIDAISYRDQVMVLDLITPDVSYLEAFDQRLTQDDQFALDIQNTSPERDGSVSSRIRIQGRNP